VVSCNTSKDIPLELMFCRLSGELEADAEDPEDPEAVANANAVPVSPAVFKLDAVAAFVGPLSWKLVNGTDVRGAEKVIACVLRPMVAAEVGALEEVDSSFVDTRAVEELTLEFLLDVEPERNLLELCSTLVTASRPAV